MGGGKGGAGEASSCERVLASQCEIAGREHTIPHDDGEMFFQRVGELSPDVDGSVCA